MKLFSLIVTIVTMTIAPIFFTSCGGGDEPDNTDKVDSDGIPNYVDKARCAQLFGTTWKQTERIILNENKPVETSLLEFTDIPFYYNNKFIGYEVKVDSKTEGVWLIFNDDPKYDFFLQWPYISSPMRSGELSMMFGGGYKTIQTINSQTLIYRYEDSYRFSYKLASNSGTSGGGSASYEKPEIGIVDWTCTKTSITAKYRIYNQDNAKVTSAKGYYGTSSASNSVSASVAGSLITFTITGLKSGTEYKIKCSATGVGGTTTSEETRLPTLN